MELIFILQDINKYYFVQVRGKLIGHRIKYWMKKDNEYNSTLEVKESQYVLSRSTKSEALIIGLLPNEYYYVRVMAYNSAGGLRMIKYFRLLMFVNFQVPALRVKDFSREHSSCDRRNRPQLSRSSVSTPPPSE